MNAFVEAVEFDKVIRENTQTTSRGRVTQASDGRMPETWSNPSKNNQFPAHWRDSKHGNDEFQAGCNGLPVAHLGTELVG